MEIKEIGLCWIHTSNLKKAEEFFSKTLGLDITSNSPEYGWLEFKGKNNGLAFGVGQENLEMSPKKAGSSAVVTFTVDNLEEFQKNLEAKGVKFTSDVMEVPGHVKLVSFEDFDGNEFQLVEVLNETK